MNSYIIHGAGMKAVAVHSDMNFIEFGDYVRENSTKLHEDGRDSVFRIGFTVEIVNPMVSSPKDFGNFCPYLIGIK